MDKCLQCAPGSLNKYPGGDERTPADTETNSRPEKQRDWPILHFQCGKWDRGRNTPSSIHGNRESREEETKQRAEGTIQMDFDSWCDSCVPGECL